MKTAIMLYLLPVLTHLSFAQTTFIANNNPGAVTGVNIFTGATAFNDALAAASDGDIIYIVPSGTNYGDIALSKELTLYGGGYNPDNQTGLKSLIRSIQISASNTRISGIRLTDTPWDGVALRINASIINTTIDKCIFNRFEATGAGIANIIIQNCIILQGSSNYGAQMFIMNSAIPNIRFSNNIVFSTQNTSWGILYGFNGAIIQNNLFIASSSGTLQRIFGRVTNSQIKNNIFFGITPKSASTFTGNSIDYNLTFNSSDNDFTTTNNTIGANNLINEDPLFVNVSYGQSWSFNYDATFQAASLAIGAGDDNTDICLYGGGTPYDDNGTPLPSVQSITLPSMISQGSDLPINIKGKGN